MHAAIDPSDVINRASDGLPPLAVTVERACELSGLGPTTMWAFLRDGRLEAVRVPGVRRTLITYQSLVKLLTPTSISPQPRRRGRPRKVPLQPASGATP